MRFISYRLFSSGLVALAVLCSGCGRAGYPFAPEDLSPRPVDKVQVIPQVESLKFTWEAPLLDASGEKLRSLDSYYVLRKEIVESSDVVDDSIAYEVVAEVPDKSFSRLQELKKGAQEKGLPQRRLQPEAEFVQHEYSDTSVVDGKRYIYQVLAVNQGNVRGQGAAFIDVLFKGEKSKISISQEMEDAAPDLEAEEE